MGNFFPMNYFRAIIRLIRYFIRGEMKENPKTVTVESSSVNDAKEWAIKKIELLHESDRHRNALALQSEFDEWINIPDGVNEIEYIYLENSEWTEEQELDVRD